MKNGGTKGPTLFERLAPRTHPYAYVLILGLVLALVPLIVALAHKLPLEQLLLNLAFSLGIELVGASIIYFVVERRSSQLERQIAQIRKYFQPEEFRVTEARDGTGLRSRKEIPGVLVDGAWRFIGTKQAIAVFGPYLRPPLAPGTYTATFKLKVGAISPGGQNVVSIEVTSRVGRKVLMASTLGSDDFGEPDHYKDFPLTFTVRGYEPDVEFRVWSAGRGDIVTLYCVTFQQEA